MNLAPGTVLGDRFTVVGVLGRGGSATVYLVEDRLRGAKVALKVLHPGAGERERRRLRREVRTAAMLRHPGVLAAHEVHELEGRWALSMPVHPGQTLSELLGSGTRLSAGELARLADTLCGVLEHAHGHGVLHRDLSPRNVMVAEDGTAVLTDFGLARVTTHATQTATVALGTPGYAAPEIYEDSAAVRLQLAAAAGSAQKERRALPVAYPASLEGALAPGVRLASAAASEPVPASPQRSSRVEPVLQRTGRQLDRLGRAIRDSKEVPDVARADMASTLRELRSQVDELGALGRGAEEALAVGEGGGAAVESVRARLERLETLQRAGRDVEVDELVRLRASLSAHEDAERALEAAERRLALVFGRLLEVGAAASAARLELIGYHPSQDLTGLLQRLGRQAKAASDAVAEADAPLPREPRQAPESRRRQAREGEGEAR